MLYGTGKYRYELVEGWAKCPEGWSFMDVGGLAIDSQDRIYVLNRGDHPVMIFDREGNLLTSWGEGFFKSAHGIYVSPDGFIYCTDDGDHTVSKFTSEGKLLLTLGTKGKPSDTGFEQKATLQESWDTIKGGPPFNRPTAVALSAAGEIYVTDGHANVRVHKFTPDGKLLSSWGEPGNGPGQFRIPHFPWVDKQERVWIADQENHRIQIFNAKGEFLDQWTGFKRPNCIFIDDEEVVYISELGRRVSIFTIDGKLLARWGSEGEDKEKGLFLGPHAVVVDSRGDLYVGEIPMTMAKVDRGLRAVLKFVRKT